MVVDTGCPGRLESKALPGYSGACQPPAENKFTGFIGFLSALQTPTPLLLCTTMHSMGAVTAVQDCKAAAMASRCLHPTDYFLLPEFLLRSPWHARRGGCAGARPLKLLGRAPCDRLVTCSTFLFFLVTCSTPSSSCILHCGMREHGHQQCHAKERSMTAALISVPCRGQTARHNNGNVKEPAAALISVPCRGQTARHNHDNVFTVGNLSM